MIVNLFYQKITQKGNLYEISSPRSHRTYFGIYEEEYTC